MKRHLLVGTVCAMIVGMLGATAWAAGPMMKIDIPFDFTVGDMTVPAGSYVLMLDGANKSTVALKRDNSGQVTRPTVVTRLADLGVSEPKFVFDTVGDTHYLSEIHIPGMDGYALQGAPVEHGHELLSGTK